MEKYYPYSEIRFSKPQMWFLIRHLAELKEGDYPEKPENYVRQPKMACKEAKAAGYENLCINCPFLPCLKPSEKTPGRVRKERSINRVLELAAEVEMRLGLVMDYISGWDRPQKTIRRDGRKK